MKSPEELKPFFDDLVLVLTDKEGALPFLSGLVTMLSYVLEVPDTCGSPGCTEDHDAMRDSNFAQLRREAARLRKLRDRHGRARAN